MIKLRHAWRDFLRSDQTHEIDIFKIMALFVLIILVGIPEAFAVPTNVDCFENAAASGNLVAQDLPCIRSTTALSTDPTLHANNLGARAAIQNLQNQQKNNPNDDIFKSLSEDAASVYYNSTYCGESNQVGAIQCSRMGELARLHTDGMYANNYNCTGSHPNCSAFSKAMVSALGGICDKNGNMGKHYCNSIIRNFLSQSYCNGSATQATCLGEFDTRLSSANPQQAKCIYSEYDIGDDMSGCTGGAPMNAARADDSVEDGVGDNPDATPISSTGPGDEGTEGNSTLDNAAANAAQSVFGNGVYSRSGSSDVNGKLSIPSVKTANANIGEVSPNNSQSQMASLQAGGLSNQSPLTRLAPPTRGNPGGKGKNSPVGSSSSGINSGGVPLGGSPVTANSGSPSGKGSNSRRRGGGNSRLKKTAEGMVLNSFMGTDGNKGPSGSVTKSKLDPQIKNQIAKNQIKSLTDRDLLKRNYRKNLNGRAGDQNLYIESSYFPDHSDVYMWLNQNSDMLDETGK